MKFDQDQIFFFRNRKIDCTTIITFILFKMSNCVLISFFVKLLIKENNNRIFTILFRNIKGDLTVQLIVRISQFLNTTQSHNQNIFLFTIFQLKLSRLHMHFKRLLIQIGISIFKRSIQKKRK